jgi:hypothetical protein
LAPSINVTAKAGVLPVPVAAEVLKKIKTTAARANTAAVNHKNIFKGRVKFNAGWVIKFFPIFKGLLTFISIISYKPSVNGMVALCREAG